MFKRAVWVGTGYGLGLGTSWWLKRKVSRKIEAQVDRYVPEGVRDKATSAAHAVNTRAHAMNEAMRPHLERANSALKGRLEQSGAPGAAKPDVDIDLTSPNLTNPKRWLHAVREDSI